MYPYVLKVTLKKPWTCNRGHCYVAGTTFTQKPTKNTKGVPGAWYDFSSPGKSHGFVFIPASVSRVPSAEDIALEAFRLAEKERASPLGLLFARADR